MACACGNDNSPEGALNDKINKDIKEQEKEKRNNYKLLLLGTGDSGKSTFVKQLKVLFKDGFSDSDRENFAKVLRHNTLEAMQILLRACEQWKIKFTKSDAVDKEIELVKSTQDLTPAVAKAIGNKLWKTKAIKAAWERENELSIPGGACAIHYFENAKRFAGEDFVPTNEDICRAKLRTTGVAETVFEVNDITFTVIDVGGQRGERRKWVGCFEDVTAVIYLSAINEYDMMLEEDPTQNRLEESLRLWTTLSRAKWFNVEGRPTLFILFMNKADLFEEKIKKKSLSTVFGDPYTTFEKRRKRTSMNAKAEKDPELDVDSAFIAQMFRANYQGDGDLYVHKTNALDTENCQKIFSAVAEVAVAKAFEKRGF